MNLLERLVLFVVGGVIEGACGVAGWFALTGSLKLLGSSYDWLRLLSIPAIVFSGLYCLAVIFAVGFLMLIVLDFSESARNTTMLCV